VTIKAIKSKRNILTRGHEASRMKPHVQGSFNEGKYPRPSPAGHVNDRTKYCLDCTVCRVEFELRSEIESLQGIPRLRRRHAHEDQPSIVAWLDERWIVIISPSCRRIVIIL
jgi:hypothetical protein